MKKTITYSEYLQIVALLSLAQSYARKMEDCERGMVEIIGQEYDSMDDAYCGNLSDAVFDKELPNVKKLLGYMKVKVLPKPKKIKK